MKNVNYKKAKFYSVLSKVLNVAQYVAIGAGLVAGAFVGYATVSVTNALISVFCGIILASGSSVGKHIADIYKDGYYAQNVQELKETEEYAKEHELTPHEFHLENEKTNDKSFTIETKNKKYTVSYDENSKDELTK